jgi:pimeloyl-ACP methyl ester carboxylesterase
MVGIMTTCVALRGGPTLSIAQQGDRAEPAVVFLPGPTDSWRSYEPVLEALPRSVRSVAVSLRGHGDSDKPAAGYRVEDFAADVIGLLDAMRITRAVLVGHSASCLTARRVAIDAPDRVAGLVLEASPTTLRDDPALGSFVDSVLSRLRDPLDSEFLRSVVVATSTAALASAFLDVLVNEVGKVPVRVWREMFGALLGYDDRGELAGITSPAWLLWGDADSVVPRGMQDELARRLPRAQRLVYAGMGHTPRWEDPARFAHDVARIVGRL